MTTQQYGSLSPQVFQVAIKVSPQSRSRLERSGARALWAERQQLFRTICPPGWQGQVTIQGYGPVLTTSLQTLAGRSCSATGVFREIDGPVALPGHGLKVRI